MLFLPNPFEYARSFCQLLVYYKHYKNLYPLQAELSMVLKMLKQSNLLRGPVLRLLCDMLYRDFKYSTRSLASASVILSWNTLL